MNCICMEWDAREQENEGTWVIVISNMGESHKCNIDQKTSAIKTYVVGFHSYKVWKEPKWTSGIWRQDGGYICAYGCLRGRVVGAHRTDFWGAWNTLFLVLGSDYTTWVALWNPLCCAVRNFAPLCGCHTLMNSSGLEGKRKEEK